MTFAVPSLPLTPAPSLLEWCTLLLGWFVNKPRIIEKSPLPRLKADVSKCMSAFCWKEYVHQFSRSVMSSSLWPHGPQHTRPPCPSPTPRVYSNSCPLSQWCHATISSSVIPFSSCLQSFPPIFPNESVLRIRWPKYCSFSFNISPSNEYSGLISFGIDWLDLLAVQRTLRSPL